MTVTRTEPDEEPDMVVEKHGQQFATDELCARIQAVEEGDSVEVDYESRGGLDISEVGTVRKRHEEGPSIDLHIDTSRERSAYLHLNGETNDIFFSPPNRKLGGVALQLFKVY